MKIIFLGAPGAGKGTQASILSEKYNIPKLSTGDMLRSAIDAGSELGKHVKNVLEKGNLVSDEIIIDIVRVRLSEDDCKNGCILDGFPRTIPQAQALDNIISNPNDIIVLCLTVDEEKLIKRISGRYSCANCGKGYHKIYNPTLVEGVCDECGAEEFYVRDDDNENAVRHRLNVYNKQTSPLIEYYSQDDRLYNIDGSDSIDAITVSIEGIISRCTSAIKQKRVF